MIMVDLRRDGQDASLKDLTPTQLFELAVAIARTLDNVTVRAPVGDHPDETVTLSSRLLQRKDVALF